MSRIIVSGVGFEKQSPKKPRRVDETPGQWPQVCSLRTAWEKFWTVETPEKFEVLINDDEIAGAKFGDLTDAEIKVKKTASTITLTIVKPRAARGSNGGNYDD